MKMSEEIDEMLKARMSEEMYNDIIEAKIDKLDGIEDYLKVIMWLLLKSGE